LNELNEFIDNFNLLVLSIIGPEACNDDFRGAGKKELNRIMNGLRKIGVLMSPVIIREDVIDKCLKESDEFFWRLPLDEE
jgi:hypothetical protein